jgi:hypothetical protein
MFVPVGDGLRVVVVTKGDEQYSVGCNPTYIILEDPVAEGDEHERCLFFPVGDGSRKGRFVVVTEGDEQYSVGCNPM